MAIRLPLGPVSWKGKLQVASVVPICVSTPFPISCFLSTNNWKGLDGSGRARAGAFSKARLSSWKASFIGSVHFKSLFSLVPLYRGLAFSANPKIHNRQYPTVFRNFFSCLGLAGSEIWRIFFFFFLIIENRPVLVKREDEWEKDALGVWDTRCKLLYIEWINNKVLLYSTGYYVQYPVINHNGKEHEIVHKDICIYN